MVTVIYIWLVFVYLVVLKNVNWLNEAVVVTCYYTLSSWTCFFSSLGLFLGVWISWLRSRRLFWLILFFLVFIVFQLMFISMASNGFGLCQMHLIKSLSHLFCRQRGPENLPKFNVLKIMSGCLLMNPYSLLNHH